jgi:hypothetical protein
MILRYTCHGKKLDNGTQPRHKPVQVHSHGIAEAPSPRFVHVLYALLVMSIMATNTPSTATGVQHQPPSNQQFPFIKPLVGFIVILTSLLYGFNLAIRT